MGLFKKKSRDTAEELGLRSEEIMDNLAQAMGSIPAPMSEPQFMPSVQSNPQVQPQQQYVQVSQPIQNTQVPQIPPVQYTQPVQPQVQPVRQEPTINQHLSKIYEFISELDKGLVTLDQRLTAIEAKLFRETQ